MLRRRRSRVPAVQVLLHEAIDLGGMLRGESIREIGYRFATIRIAVIDGLGMCHQSELAPSAVLGHGHRSGWIIVLWVRTRWSGCRLCEDFLSAILAHVGFGYGR